MSWLMEAWHKRKEEIVMDEGKGRRWRTWSEGRMGDWKSGIEIHEKKKKQGRCAPFMRISHTNFSSPQTNHPLTFNLSTRTYVRPHFLFSFIFLFSFFPKSLIIFWEVILTLTLTLSFKHSLIIGRLKFIWVPLNLIQFLVGLRMHEFQLINERILLIVWNSSKFHCYTFFSGLSMHEFQQINKKVLVDYLKFNLSSLNLKGIYF